MLSIWDDFLLVRDQQTLEIKYSIIEMPDAKKSQHLLGCSIAQAAHMSAMVRVSLTMNFLAPASHRFSTKSRLSFARLLKAAKSSSEVV